MSKCPTIVKKFYGNVTDKVNKLCMDCLDGSKLQCYGDENLPNNFEINNPRSTLNYYMREETPIQIEKYGNKKDTDALRLIRCTGYADEKTSYIDGYAYDESGSNGTQGNTMKKTIKFTCKDYKQNFQLPENKEELQETVVKNNLEQTYTLFIFIILVLIIPIFLLNYDTYYIDVRRKVPKFY